MATTTNIEFAQGQLDMPPPLTEGRGAVQLLGERVETLTAELAEGGLPELIRLAASALRTET